MVSAHLNTVLRRIAHASEQCRKPITLGHREGNLNLPSRVSLYRLIVGLCRGETIGLTKLVKTSVIIREFWCPEFPNVRFPPRSDIHLFGVQDSAAIQIIEQDRATFILNRGRGQSGFRNAVVSVRNPNSILRLLDTIDSDIQTSLKQTIQMLQELSVDELVELALAAALGRDHIEKPRIQVQEVGQPVVINSLAGNMRRYEISGAQPRASQSVTGGSKSLRACELTAEEDTVCLKNGTSNLLLAYLAATALYEAGIPAGRRLQGLFAMLSCRYSSLLRDRRRAQRAISRLRRSAKRDERDELIREWDDHLEKLQEGISTIERNRLPGIARLVSRLEDLDFVSRQDAIITPRIADVTVSDLGFRVDVHRHATEVLDIKKLLMEDYSKMHNNNPNRLGGRPFDGLRPPRDGDIPDSD